MMKKKKCISALLILFVLLSYIFISPIVSYIRCEYRSSDLKQITSKEGNSERTDYLDSDGNITIAADTGYATMIRRTTSEGIIEEYYDDGGREIRRQAGYYAVLRQYNDTGKNNRIIFLDKEYNPCITKDGYAIEERKYNEKNQIIAIRYYDAEGKPVCTALYGHAVINEYDEKGQKYKTTYMDLLGKPMITSLGYASIIRQYYSDNDSDSGRVNNEFYYDDQGKPIALSLGEYGLHREYNEIGQSIILTFLDSEGKPTVTKEGYTTITRTFMPDNSIATEQYYDMEGKPFSLSEGQYGFKREHRQTVFLDKNGNETFNLRNLLYNRSWIVIPFTIAAVMVSSLIGKKYNLLLLVPCLFTIVYLTLMFREDIGNKGIDLLGSYKHFFSDSEARADIIRNIWLFIPLGAILYQLYPQKIIMLLPVILSISIECIQYFNHMGFCELDDVISNSLGAWIGYAVGELTIAIRVRIKSWIHIHIV